MNTIAATAPATRLPGRRALTAWLCAALLCALAAPLVHQAADFLNYADFFAIAREASAAEAFEERFEPLFAALAVALARLIGSDVVLFSVLMTASLLVKCRWLLDIAPHRVAGVALVTVFAVRYMPLHEMTQIRLALALSLWVLALRARRLGPALLLAGAAVGMHYSAVLVLPVWLGWRRARRLPPQGRDRYGRWLLAGSVLMVAATLFVDPVLQALSTVIGILDVYASGGFGDDQVNPFSIAVVLDAALLASGWLATRGCVQARFWLLVLGLSLVAFYALAGYPVLAHRVREMMSICWLPYLACALARRGAPRLHAQAAIAAMLPVYGYLNFIGPNALFRIG